MMRFWWLTVTLVLLALPARAVADVQRFAVMVGNNLGTDDDVPLRYAESDANKMARVLQDLGGFHPANIVLLQGRNQEMFRSTLITLNDRIRNLSTNPATQVVLFVYYSGHADARALHQGETRFELKELAQLVRGSPATFRLLVVDACRSGMLILLC